jgi:cyanophycinase
VTAFRPVPDPHDTHWREETSHHPPGAHAHGTLLIVGGSERLDRDFTILRTFVQLADAVPGRRDLVILTAATGHPEILGGEYRDIFAAQLGWNPRHIHMPEVGTREQAEDPATAALLAGAAAIYMTGGDQVALLDVLGHTATEAAMLAAYHAGAVIGGTSAGATAMGDPMIARGGGSGELRRGMVTIKRGMGLAGTGLFLDTHFGERGRFPRMCAALAEDPQALGVGIDENTALILRPQTRRVEVIGRGVVYFLDGHKAHAVTVPLGAPLPLTPVSLHILTNGDCYDLERRRPIED